MARDNPSNPFTQDPQHTQKDVPLPVQKAKVLDADGQPGGGFHTVRIRVYGDGAAYQAPVLTPMFGSVWVPEPGTDVAVIYGNSDKPWVIGSWYPRDRVEDGDVDLPDYEPGDIILGNENGYIGVEADGTVVDSAPESASISETISLTHTEWPAAMNAEEVWRTSLAADETLTVERLEVAGKAGSSTADLTLDIYEVDTDTVLASTNGVQSGDPIAESASGSTVVARITNDTSSRIVASVNAAIDIR